MADKVWIAQGWDVSKWDQSQYVWDGQKGFNAALGTVTVNGNAATLAYGRRYSAQTTAVTVTSIQTGLSSGRSMLALRGMVNVNFIGANLRAALRVGATTTPIVVNGFATTLRSGRSMPASAGSILVNGTPATVVFTVAYHMGCGTGRIYVNGVAGQCNLTAYLQPGPLNFGVQRVVIPNRW